VMRCSTETACPTRRGDVGRGSCANAPRARRRRRESVRMAGPIWSGDHRTNQGGLTPGWQPGLTHPVTFLAPVSSKNRPRFPSSSPFMSSCRCCRRRGQARGLGRRPRPRHRSGAPRRNRFKALPLVEDGAALDFKLTRQDLALACASHSSEPAQVTLVREFLQRIGCSERDLMCGPHRPLSDAVAKDYEMRGVRLTAIYSNCSGKHTRVCWRSRSTTAGRRSFYARSSIPVQKRCLKAVSDYTRASGQRDRCGGGGCGVAASLCRLRNMALA